jgi:hypothetical protein
LNRALFVIRPSTIAFEGGAPLCALASRFLLLLSGVLLAATPLTQSLWNWDHFLQGGQDFESGILLIVVSLCLLLVLSQLCRQTLKLLFASWHQSSSGYHSLKFALPASVGMSSTFHIERAASSAYDMVGLPLQI